MWGGSIGGEASVCARGLLISGVLGVSSFRGMGRGRGGSNRGGPGGGFWDEWRWAAIEWDGADENTGFVGAPSGDAVWLSGADRVGMSALVLSLAGDGVVACCGVRECAMGSSLATVFTDDVGDSCGGWGMGASLIRGEVGVVSLEPEGCAVGSGVGSGGVC